MSATNPPPADEASGATSPPREAVVEVEAVVEAQAGAGADTGVETERTTKLGSNFYKLFTGTVVSNLGDGVGSVAYPWLASALTRNPILIALVAVAQRLPWLLFTLPAGVITDRVDRRKAMLSMDVLRGFITLGVAFAVLAEQDALPAPDALDDVIGTQTALYLVLLLATFLLGMAEVLRDNANQTILPQIVHKEQLEKANGRIWSVEGVMNTFVGPPVGSLLLIAAFSLPFFIDAASFFIAAAMVALIPGTFRAATDATDQAARPSFRAELLEGVRWLRAHPVLYPMAIILGFLNAAGMIAGATIVLFAQEVLDVGPLLFTILFFGAAVGGLVGGNVAPWISKRLGSGNSLALVLGGSAVSAVLIAAFPWWPLVLVLFGIDALLAITWNVITVSFRQSIIPERMLGRVNSVYRFFAWGMIPIGAAVGGLVVWSVERFADRDIALRSTYLAAAIVYVALFFVSRSRLTTAAMDRARAEAAPVS